jgi:hypothetical protein
VDIVPLINRFCPVRLISPHIRFLVVVAPAEAVLERNRRLGTQLSTFRLTHSPHILAHIEVRIGLHFNGPTWTILSA